MDKNEMIEKLRLVFDVCGTIIRDDARLALAETISALQSSVVLTVKQADALLNDDGNDNQAAVDEVERQLAAIEAKEKP